MPERGSGEGTFLVERYWPGVTAEALEAAIGRLRRAMDAMAAEGHPVRHLQCTLVPEEESVFCLFRAPAPDDVAEANRRAEFPLHRVVEAVHLPQPQAGGSG